MNFDPQGECYPFVHPMGELSLLLRKMNYSVGSNSSIGTRFKTVSAIIYICTVKTYIHMYMWSKGSFYISNHSMYTLAGFDLTTRVYPQTEWVKCMFLITVHISSLCHLM
jgi:hypothetical protein